MADDGDDGFTVYGLYEPYEPPNFYSRDCAATNCYYGFNGWNGTVGFSIICPGLYNNYQDKNFPEMPFTDPVYEVNDPLVIDSNDYRIFLDPNSQFVNQGSGITPFLGWTTNINGTPDEGIGDIWPHYQTKRVELLLADLNSDHAVDMNDLAEFVDQWLVPDANSADLNNDQTVNFLDFSIFASQWQLTEMYIDLVDVETCNSIDPNNVSGYVGICLKNIPLSAQTVSVYLDNTPIDNWIRDWTNWELIGFESYFFSNGWHTIHLVGMDIYCQVVNYKPINVRFNNLLYKVTADDYFHHSEDKEIGGFYDGNDTLEAEVTNWDGQVIWSDTYSGSHINIVIPGAMFSNKHICELTIEESEGGMASTADSKKWKKKIYKKFVKEDFSGVRMVLLLPSPDLVDAKFSLICTIMNSCELQNVPYGCIYYHDNTPENWTYVFRTLGGAKDIYYGGHANSHVGSVQRTNLVTYRKIPGPDWFFVPPIGWGTDPLRYYEVPALSHTKYSEQGAEELPNNLDEWGFDLRDLNLKEDDKIRIGWFDGCRTAGYESGEEGEDRICCPDLAKTFGFLSLKAQGNKRSIFFGWRMITENRPGLPDIFSFVNAGQKIIWEALGEGRTIGQALERTDVSNIYIRQSLWGEDMQRDFDPAGDDNLFAYGSGLLWDMKLRDVLE